MRFRAGKVVFHRLEIRTKATNIAEIESKRIRCSVKTPMVIYRKKVRSMDICGPHSR